MPISDLRLIDFEIQPITTKRILKITNLAPRKICFSSQPNVLKKRSLNKSIGLFSVPFSESIRPIFEIETKIKLLYDPAFDISGLPIFNENDYAKIEEFIKKYSDIVFIRDCLDMSIALSEIYIDEEITELGFLGYEAKYSVNNKAVQKIYKICSEWIVKLPFYTNADYICAIPSNQKGIESLPAKIVGKFKKFPFKDISNAVSWINEKSGLKSTDYEMKLELLEARGLNIDVDLKGKIVILFDDLYQSGISMQFIAMKMKEAGASRIFGLSIVKS